MSKITRDQRKFKFETLQLHVGTGTAGSGATDARAVPIYQTFPGVFRNRDHAAARFDLQMPVTFTDVLQNPTEDVIREENRST